MDDEMVSADEALAMEHRSDGCDEAADVMHMERSALVVMRADGAREARDVMVSDVPYVAHWWPLTSDGRPCAWPTAEVSR